MNNIPLPYNEKYGAIVYRVGGSDGMVHNINDAPAKTYRNGTKMWYKDDKIHRDGDQPAIMKSDGTLKWYKDGKLHRDGDEPALVTPYNRKEWYKDGKHHRDGDQPAIIGHNLQEWYKNGKSHRDGDLPAYISDMGKVWYKNGKTHRDGDSPASVQFDRLGNVIHQEWYKDGKRHREDDKPAVVGRNGNREWYYNDVRHRENQSITDGRVASITVDKYLYDSGKQIPRIVKSVYKNGVLTNPNGPARLISYERELGRTSPPDEIEFWICNIFIKTFDYNRAEEARIFFNTYKKGVLKIQQWAKNWLRGNAFETAKKDKRFIEWLYSPENIGGKMGKFELKQMLMNEHGVKQSDFMEQ
jgi:hypothetical protein